MSNVEAPAASASWATRYVQLLVVSLLGLLYMVVSAGLISFNKFLLARFPFSVFLVLLHMACSSVLTSVLYFLRPSLFPALACAKGTNGRAQLSSGALINSAMPIALFFALSLVLSNTAYLYSSVAFLQMMKEGNIVVVYLFSLLAAMEYWNLRNAAVLLLIFGSTALTVQGEANFSMAGFLIQCASQLFECMRIVLQTLLLAPGGKKMDPLSYVFLVSPLSFVALTVFWGALHSASHFWTTPVAFGVPHMADVAAVWPLLAANCLVACSLNIIIAAFMARVSAVSLILTGIVKDAIIVLVGWVVFHESVTGVQIVGFVMQLLLILLWSLMKTFRDEFEDGILTGLWRLIRPTAPEEADDEDSERGTLLPKGQAAPVAS